MPTLDARGHAVPTAADAPSREGWVLAPLRTVRDPRPVAGTSARATAVTELTDAGQEPSPSNPAFFFRADAPAGREVEYTTNGSTFRTLTDDGGTATCSYGAGFAGTSGYTDLLVSRSGRHVILRGRVARGSGTGILVGTVPVGFRPEVPVSGGIVSLGAGTADGTRFLAEVATTGDITLAPLSGSPAWATSTWIPLNLTWWVA